MTFFSVPLVPTADTHGTICTTGLGTIDAVDVGALSGDGT